MTLAELLLLGAALAMDAVAASVTLGLRVRRLRWRDTLAVGAAFGGFQALMPAIGYWLGSTLHGLLAAIDHWVAFGLLAILGVRMMRDARKPDDSPANDSAPMRSLLPLAIATSIDALTVGVTLALDAANVAQAVGVIGCITALLCMLAFRLGGRLGQRFCGRAQCFGGLVLLAIGTNLLYQHIH